MYGRAFDRVLSVPLFLYALMILALMGSIFISVSRSAVMEAARDPVILNAVKLSFFTSAVSTALSLLFAVPSGYLLSRKRFPGARIVDALLDMPIILPPLVVGLSVLIFFSTRIGRFIDTRVIEFVYTWRGVILVQFIIGSALAVRVVKSGFDGLQWRYEEVAMSLGANRFQAFIKVAVPEIRPHLVAAAVISWARIFGLFGPVVMVCGTMPGRTQIMPTAIFLEVAVGRIEAALVIAAFMVIISVVTLAVFKRLSAVDLVW